MKLAKILLENEWRPLTSAEVENDKEELFKMIDTAYAPLGGHPNVKNANDIKSAAQGYLVIDLDDDPENDATIMTKNRAGGTKLVGNLWQRGGPLSGFLPFAAPGHPWPMESNTYAVRSLDHTRKFKRPPDGWPFKFGGGGGNRTRVRK